MIALGVGPALGDPIRPAVGNKISRCTEIRRPGSYVLTRNLTAVSDCLVVASDFVTIDLGGWTIFGDDTSGSAIIARGEQRRDITVRNGTITGIEYGVDLRSTHSAVVENVRVYVGHSGILTGPGSTVRDNIVDAAGTAIFVRNSSIVSGNIASGDFGIGAGVGSIVSGNAVGAKTGIVAGPLNIVSGNTVVASTTGMVVDVGSTVSGNTATFVENDGVEGISVKCPSNVIGNTATGATEFNLKLIGDGCADIDNVAP